MRVVFSVAPEPQFGGFQLVVKVHKNVKVKKNNVNMPRFSRPPFATLPIGEDGGQKHSKCANVRADWQVTFLG